MIADRHADLGVCLFVKSPEPGRVKTRLAPAVGLLRAARLYEAFALDLLDELRAANLRVTVFFDPPEHSAAVRRWLGGGEEHLAQAPGDLGARMHAAFTRIFAARPEVSKAVLLGSDLPDLPAGHVLEAARLLDSADAVLAPSEDGGYWLVGFARAGYSPTAFHGVNWSGADVHASSAAALRDAGRRVALGPAWRDVDDGADLEALRLRLDQRRTAASRTRRVLAGIPLSADAGGGC